VDTFNKDITKIYKDYIYAVCCGAENGGEDDCILPVTKTKILHKFSPRNPKGLMNPKSLISTFLKETRRKTDARSLFSAMTGKGDEFVDVVDAVRNYRISRAKVDMNSFPACETEFDTNSYMLDFMLHGQLKHLPSDNGVPMTEAYASLSAFQESLKMIAHSINMIIQDDKKKKEDIVLLAVNELVAELEKRLKHA